MPGMFCLCRSLCASTTEGAGINGGSNGGSGRHSKQPPVQPAQRVPASAEPGEQYVPGFPIWVRPYPPTFQSFSFGGGVRKGWQPPEQVMPRALRYR